ncbi:multicopper oxidase domain-containing protein [Nocardia sp. 2]|uniref:Multicopper oxidase CueO n=1 Tax=Nocardia acididurans TaxID=2802282 RepID=A0ABS1MEK8_9NOCA|nr:multicopper oxidase domain-containing protein [Nocardia acididurans]MBL1078726.1 multicopper oxidase domain-containing protein [Nocardia acididurans]
MVSRRGFLTGFAVTSLAVVAGCSPGRDGSAGSATGGSAAGATRPLPIPPLAASTIDAAGVRVFDVEAQAGTTEMLAGKHTATWGFNGSVLGPTLRARRGEAVRCRVRNSLPEPTTVHWHGMHVPARSDGGPHQMIAPGAEWTAEWTVAQQAGTLWYHPHPHGVTEKHVYRGLSGLFLVDDDEADALGLPGEYGVDDIPLVIQDRRFTPDGALDESAPTDVGLLGDTIVTNGIAGAHLEVRTERIRLRMLNGSSGRIYTLGFSDDRVFQLVATDGGLMPKAVPLNRIQLSPGERAEIVVTVRAGEPVTLRSTPVVERDGIDRAAEFGFDDSFDILSLRPASTLRPAAEVPATLVPMTALAAATTAPDHAFELKWFMINNQRMDMNRVDLTIPVESTQVWTVRNNDNWPHNFHVHDVQYQVLAVDGAAPPPELSGWKDTIYTAPGVTYTLAMHFADYTDPAIPYMYHCHLLLHEDRGMMGQFLVLGPGERPAPMDMSGSPHGRHG